MLYFEDIVTLVLIGIFFLGVVWMFLVGIFISGLGGTDGEYIGYVTTVEHNTNLLWDSDLVYVKTELESSQEDLFCFTDEVKDQLKKANEDRERVKLHFANNYIMWRSDCNDGGVSIIDSVSSIN